MKISDLRFSYPDELVATEPRRPSRVMWVDCRDLCGVDNQKADLQKDSSITEAQELAWSEFLEKIPSGDVLVVNDTKVVKRRVFSSELEILFLDLIDPQKNIWSVLFPSKKMKIGQVINLPGSAQMTLLEKGRPQKVQLDQFLNDDYFEKYGEVPLPPYIQKARGERHHRKDDEAWYQTVWAENPGSFAAPTASLHFSPQDLERLRAKGVKILKVTLHVGLGTFLPVLADDLNDHKMHSEFVEISIETWEEILRSKLQGKKIWSLGTTTTRALESQAKGLLQKNTKSYLGLTDILIQPGFQWSVVDCLLTNFHQPESTLLALVASFSSLERVQKVYQIAIEKKFRLFSYGDLSVWVRSL